MTIEYKAHPWHGISAGDKAPSTVTAFIEIVPSDTVKYEIDKETGYLKIDRPQKFSNTIPALYGFIPRTYCGDKVAEYARDRAGDVKVSRGDRDPLDICVLSERNVSHGNIILPAIPVGGFRMIDNGEADDKIIAVMKGDEFYMQWNDVTDCPDSYIDRLRHYFLTYKSIPGEDSTCQITHVYGREEAYEVILRSMSDYKEYLNKSYKP